MPDLVIMRPAYIIGRRLVKANESASDALDEVLLYPAFGDGADIVKAQVSSRQLDRLNELAIEAATKPFTREDRDAHMHNGVAAATARTSVRHVARQPGRGLNTERKLPLANPDREPRALRRMSEKLLRHGIGIFVTSRGGMLIGPEVADQFQVPLHTRNLAKLFDREHAYEDTIGTLSSTY